MPILVLLSGAGLVGLLVFNLWTAVATQANRGELEARRRADVTAAALRGLLRDERLLSRLPAGVRFAVRDGEVVVPAEVGWLTPPQFPGREDLDVVVRDRLQSIGEGGTDPVATMRALIDRAGSPANRQWLVADAAWRAHRAGDARALAGLLQELDAVHGGSAPAATLLLHATAFGSLPAWAGARVPLLPEGLAMPLLRRLRELGVETGGLEARWREAAARRAVLAAAARVLPAVVERRPAVRPVSGDRLLLLHDNDGALVTREQLVAALAGLAGEDWTGLPEDFGDALAPAGITRDLVTVVPDYLAVQVRVPEQDFGGAWVPGLLVLALASISGAGLWVFYRGVRRETEAARARSDFLTMVTHELKTPLAGIRLLAEMLQGGHVAGREQREDYYRRLNNESIRLTMLIENVLDLGRMERGERVYDFAEVDVDRLVADAVELFTPIAGAAGMQVQGPGGAVGLVIRGDRGALLQSLLNVMDNARKYAATGGRLEVDVSPREYTCEVLVRDFGEGIPEGERRRVFERFRRGVRHAHGAVPGVGLGLYLSRTILHNHGGDLEAIPPRDGGPGVCFRFALPIARRETTLHESCPSR